MVPLARPPRRLATSLITGLFVVLAACSGSGDDIAATTSPSIVTTTTAAPTTTTTTPPPPPLDTVTFDLDVRDPTMPVIALGDWDRRFTYSPWAVLDDDTFHLFYTGWGIPLGIGYATSPDGATFTKVGEGPVLALDAGTVEAEAPVVYVEDDGTWVMYFSELANRRTPTSSIRRATAPAPGGPWTVDEHPIYTSGAGEWDAQAVPQSIVVTEDEVLLFYDGRTGTTAESGLLRSPDGVAFAPYDDPATPYGADPVIGVPGVQAWDGSGAASPMVIAGDGYLEMFYVGFLGPDPTDTTVRIGYARSNDGGITWVRHPDNPIVVLEGQRQTPTSLGFPWMGATKAGDTYFIYYAIAAGSEGIGLITGTVTEE